MSTMAEMERRLRCARPDVNAGPPPWSEVRSLIDAEDSRRERPRLWRRGRVAVPLSFAVLLLAAAGGSALLFGAGSPVPSWSVLPSSPNTGLGQAVPSSLHALPIRVPDPAGGPPWGMRIIETTRGEACLQGGRVVEGRLGGLGIGYAFKADGRFHPFMPADAVSYDSCATLGGKGGAFQPNAPQIVTADGLPLAGENVPPADRVKCNLPNEKNVKVRCPQADLREVAMGMLGPDAASIRVSVPGQASFTVTPYGRDGAYLIVLPAPPHADPEWPASPRLKTALRAHSPWFEQMRRLRSEMATLHVTYKNGAQCQIPGTLHSAHCPPEGIEQPGPMPTSAQLATPVHVSYLPSSDASALSAIARSGLSSFRSDFKPERAPGPALQVTFDAPLAAPNALSAYDVELEPHEVAGCNTPGRIVGEPTSEDITKGEQMQITVPLETSCQTTYSGRVFYARTSGSYSEVRTSDREDEGPLYQVIGGDFGGGQHSMSFPTVGTFQITAPSSQATAPSSQATAPSSQATAPSSQATAP